MLQGPSQVLERRVKFITMSIKIEYYKIRLEPPLPPKKKKVNYAFALVDCVYCVHFISTYLVTAKNQHSLLIIVF